MSSTIARKPRQAAAEARRGGESFVASRWYAVLARSGFVARAAVYLIIGVLAVKVALGDGGKLTNQKGAFETIAHEPAGHLLLILVAIALAGYSLWRLLRAALGHGREASDSGFDRVSAFGSGIVYAALCAIALSILIGSSAGGSGSSGAKKATGGVLGWPGGPWLVGAAGLVMVAIGLFQLYRGLSREFLDDSKTEQLSPAPRRAFEWAGVVGYCARAVVFGLVGAFLVDAAATYDPAKAVGIDGALAKLAHQPLGPYLLGLVAAGLVAFGLYSLVDARYHRI